MAFRVFSPRPQRLPACGRRSRSFGLGEKISETWERQRQKPFVRKYRLIRSMFLHVKSNASSDNFGQHVSPERWRFGQPANYTKSWIEAGNFGKLRLRNFLKIRGLIMQAINTSWCGISRVQPGKTVLFATPILHYPPLGGPDLRIDSSIKALSRVSN